MAPFSMGTDTIDLHCQFVDAYRVRHTYVCEYECLIRMPYTSSYHSHHVRDARSLSVHLHFLSFTIKINNREWDLHLSARMDRSGHFLFLETAMPTPAVSVHDCTCRNTKIYNNCPGTFRPLLGTVVGGEDVAMRQRENDVPPMSVGVHHE